MLNELNANPVATLHYWWDNQDANNAGWYVEARDSNGDFLEDSVKVWFPVDVEDFDATQGAELLEALNAAFPGATCEAR